MGPVSASARSEQAIAAAAAHGSLDMLRFLVAHGAVAQPSALKQAVCRGHLAAVEFLLSSGADLRVALSHLSGASAGGHLPVVRFLVEAGADLREHGEESLTAAARHGRVDVVGFLFDRGVGIGGEVMEAAISDGQLPLVEFLCARGVDVRANDDAALKLAIEAGRQPVVDLLLSKGAVYHGDRLALVREVRKHRDWKGSERRCD